MLWAHNGLLSVFANAGLVADAEALFGAMQDRGPKPDMVAHNTLISAYAQVCGAAIILLHLCLPVLLGLGPQHFCLSLHCKHPAAAPHDSLLCARWSVLRAPGGCM